MTEAVQIVADQIAEEMLRQKSQTSAIDAILYLRKQVGTDFDETFHQIAKRLGDNSSKSVSSAVE